MTCREVFRILPKVEFFGKIVNDCKSLMIFSKSFILDIWLGSVYTSALRNWIIFLVYYKMRLFLDVDIHLNVLHVIINTTQPESYKVL